MLESSSITFYADIYPDALIKTTITSDGRVVLQFLTPAMSSITISLEQAKTLQGALILSINQIEKGKT
jgi:hypothetical protein